MLKNYTTSWKIISILIDCHLADFKKYFFQNYKYITKLKEFGIFKI